MQAASLQSLSASLLMTFQELPKQNECIWYSKTCARSRIHPCPTAIHSNQSWGKKKSQNAEGVTSATTTKNAADRWFCCRSPPSLNKAPRKAGFQVPYWKMFHCWRVFNPFTLIKCQRCEPSSRIRKKSTALSPHIAFRWANIKYNWDIWFSFLPLNISKEIINYISVEPIGHTNTLSDQKVLL